jgi:hypothetical protein
MSERSKAIAEFAKAAFGPKKPRKPNLMTAWMDQISKSLTRKETKSLDKLLTERKQNPPGARQKERPSE